MSSCGSVGRRVQRSGQGQLKGGSSEAVRVGWEATARGGQRQSGGDRRRRAGSVGRRNGSTQEDRLGLAGGPYKQALVGRSSRTSTPHNQRATCGERHAETHHRALHAHLYLLIQPAVLMARRPCEEAQEHRHADEGGHADPHREAHLRRVRTHQARMPRVSIARQVRVGRPVHGVRTRTREGGVPIRCCVRPYRRWGLRSSACSLGLCEGESGSTGGLARWVSSAQEASSDSRWGQARSGNRV